MSIFGLFFQKKIQIINAYLLKLNFWEYTSIQITSQLTHDIKANKTLILNP